MEKIKLDIQLFAVTKSTTFAESAISIENNTSTLKITIKFSPNNDSTYFSSKTLKCTCNGTQQTTSVSLSKGGSVTKTFTFSNISHNADGTKSVSWSWSCATGTSALGTISASGTKTLTTIQRYGKITNISGAITDSTITIDWHSYNANWVYDLQIDGYYTYRNIGSSVGDHTININVGNDYFDNASTEEILPITYSLKTYPSDESWSYFNSLNTMILLNEEVKPTISIGTLTEAGDVPSNWGVFVQNKSKLNIPTTSNGAAGSKIERVINNNGSLYYRTTTPTSPLNYTFTTDYLTTSGSNTIEIIAYDTRNRQSSAASTTYNVVAYSNPTITTAIAKRVNDSNIEDDEGTKLNITFEATISPVSNKNTNIFRIGYREKGSNTSFTYKTLVNNDKSTYSVPDTYINKKIDDWTLSSSNAYEIVFEAIDSFRTASNPVKQTRYIETGKPLMNFNASGKAMAIGKVSEAGANEELLEIELATKSYNNMENDRNTGDSYYRAKRTDTNVAVDLLVGTGGTNHGLYSRKLDKWMIYGDNNDVWYKKVAIENNDGQTIHLMCTDASGGTHGKLYTTSGLELYHKQGTTSATGRSELALGNNKASGTAGNKDGTIRLYTTGTGSNYLARANNGHNNTYWNYMPNSAGTLVVPNSFVIETKEAYTTAVASGSTKDLSFNVAKTNYKPIALIGVRTTGTRSSFVNIYEWYLTDTTVHVVFRNTHTSNALVNNDTKITITILYVSNS